MQVRWEALQALCCAPPSDVLSCESWSSLRRNLCAALSDPDLGVSHVSLVYLKMAQLTRHCAHPLNPFRLARF